MTFLPSNNGEDNKEQEIVEERIEKEVGTGVKRIYPQRKVIFLTFFCNPFMHQLWKMHHYSALLNVDIM